jgi:site-specific recombinase XerD
MYEHLRNDFISRLSSDYGRKDIERITAMLDSVVKDYEISSRNTDLMVVDDTMPRLVKIYLASKAVESCSDLTIRNYRIILEKFFYMVTKAPQDIEANDIRLYLAAYKMQHKISNRTLEKHREIICAFFSWLADEEYIPKNPGKTLKAIKYEVTPRHALTRFQLERLRRMVKDKRELAILDVLYSTGCRVSELVNIKLSDLDMDARSIHIIGKGSKHNTVYLNNNAYISLLDYLEIRKGNSPYLFPRCRYPYEQLSVRAVQHIFDKYRNKLGCELSPHIVRHTTATLSLQAGMPITQIQKMLGHANVSTTQIYAETCQDDLIQSHKKYVV